ncbi:Luc7-like protein 3 [Blyttiomyces sp. JEL0837]|nr:Luc7-like protein 3 [Blyttiomyces sp. JEL0837]
MLAGFCPHDLFTNTKFDLGPCPYKVHDEKLQKRYLSSHDHRHLGYEQDFEKLLQKLISDMDRTVRRAKERLESNLTNGDEPPVDEEGEKTERIISIEVQIKELTAQMEEFGEQGEVEKASELLERVEMLKQSIEIVKNATGARKLMICDVCSACLVANDSTQRLDAHLIGKQHTGYTKIREWLDEYRKSQQSSRPIEHRDKAWGSYGGDHRDHHRHDRRDNGRNRGYNNDSRNGNGYGRHGRDQKPYDRNGNGRYERERERGRNGSYDDRRKSGGGGGYDDFDGDRRKIGGHGNGNFDRDDERVYNEQRRGGSGEFEERERRLSDGGGADQSSRRKRSMWDDRGE